VPCGCTHIASESLLFLARFALENLCSRRQPTFWTNPLILNFSAKYVIPWASPKSLPKFSTMLFQPSNISKISLSFGFLGLNDTPTCLIDYHYRDSPWKNRCNNCHFYFFLYGSREWGRIKKRGQGVGRPSNLVSCLVGQLWELYICWGTCGKV